MLVRNVESITKRVGFGLEIFSRANHHHAKLYLSLSLSEHKICLYTHICSIIHIVHIKLVPRERGKLEREGFHRMKVREREWEGVTQGAPECQLQQLGRYRGTLSVCAPEWKFGKQFRAKSIFSCRSLCLFLPFSHLPSSPDAGLYIFFFFLPRLKWGPSRFSIRAIVGAWNN